MSTFIRSAIVALALVGTVSAASANPNTVTPYQDVHSFWSQFAK
jgi:hypothetical protein